MEMRRRAGGLLERANMEMRTFETGATRSDNKERLDYEGFLSPLVLKRYAEYLHKHRRQADGTLRASDNWQKGIPIEVYMKSKWRHFMSTWLWFREGGDGAEESLCAELFNTMGMLHEILRGKNLPSPSSPTGIFYPCFCARCHHSWISKTLKEPCPCCGKDDMVCTCERSDEMPEAQEG